MNDSDCPPVVSVVVAYHLDVERDIEQVALSTTIRREIGAGEARTFGRANEWAGGDFSIFEDNFQKVLTILRPRGRTSFPFQGGTLFPSFDINKRRNLSRRQPKLSLRQLSLFAHFPGCNK